MLRSSFIVPKHDNLADSYHSERQSNILGLVTYAYIESGGFGATVRLSGRSVEHRVAIST